MRFVNNGRAVTTEEVKRLGELMEERRVAKIWRNLASGQLFHDECFDEGESRDGFKPVTLEELTEDDECENCSGELLAGPLPSDDDDDDDADDTEDKE